MIVFPRYISQFTSPLSDVFVTVQVLSFIAENDWF